jgi:hypothetical protein
MLHDAIPQSQWTFVNSYGVERRQTTTRGWELLVEWRNGSSDWVMPKGMKDSHPVELAMYATAHTKRRASVFLVGTLHFEKTETHLTKGEDKVLGLHSQVRHTLSQEHQSID